MVKKIEEIGRFEQKYPEERVLFELYRMRGLTKEQLSKAIFAGERYTVDYIRRIQKENLIGGRVLNNGNRRIAKLYQITDKGIELLESKGLVKRYIEDERALKGQGRNKALTYEEMKQMDVYIPRKVLAYDNNHTSDKDKMMFTLYTNELYAGLSEYGFYFYDSREWKLKFNLNRNTMVRGGIRTLDGTEYSVYMLFTENEVRIASMSEKMLYRMMHEMTEFPQTSKHIIYVYGGQTEYDKVLTFFKNNLVPCEELLIIPHGTQNIGINIIRLLQDKNNYVRHIERKLNARLNSNITNQTENLFADYLAEINGHSYYLIDNITLNESKISSLLRQYTPDKYQRTGIPVIILCWNAMGSKLQELFEIYPYIKIVEMDIIDDLSSWIAELEPRKMYLDW